MTESIVGSNRQKNTMLIEFSNKPKTALIDL